MRYLNDIVIFSHEFGAYLQHFKTNLTYFSPACPQRSLKKHFFGAQNLLTLGHAVYRDDVPPDPTKLRATDEFP